MLKFYMTPGSCTTGIHILLEELDLLFEVHLVNLLAGDSSSDEFLSLNPKGSIPVLITEQGRVITEFQAIAWWLARSYPKAGLLPNDIEGEVRVLEMMDYAVATLHGQAFTRIFTSEKYSENPLDHAAIKQQGRDMVDACFKVIDGMLGETDYVTDSFSIADAALFYPEFWAVHSQIALPPRCQRHFEILLARPAVKRVLYEEGYQPERLARA